MTTTSYIYELNAKKQRKIRKQVTEKLHGIVAADRLEREVEIVLSGRVKDLVYLEVEI